MKITNALSAAALNAIKATLDGGRMYYFAGPVPAEAGDALDMVNDHTEVVVMTESGDGTLAWRFPMADLEIQNGASLTVRESQIAMFVNEGRVADVFGPGRYTLTTATLFDYARTPDELRELAEPLFAEAEAGGIRARIDRVLPLADAARAHELLEERKTTGKLLLAT